MFLGERDQKDRLLNKSSIAGIENSFMKEPCTVSFANSFVIRYTYTGIIYIIVACMGGKLIQGGSESIKSTSHLEPALCKQIFKGSKL